MIPLEGGGDAFDVDVQAELADGLARWRDGELGRVQGLEPRQRAVDRSEAVGLRLDDWLVQGGLG